MTAFTLSDVCQFHQIQTSERYTELSFVEWLFTLRLFLGAAGRSGKCRKTLSERLEKAPVNSRSYGRFGLFTCLLRQYGAVHVYGCIRNLFERPWNVECYSDLPRAFNFLNEMKCRHLRRSRRESNVLTNFWSVISGNSDCSQKHAFVQVLWNATEYVQNIHKMSVWVSLLKNSQPWVKAHITACKWCSTSCIIVLIASVPSSSTYRCRWSKSILRSDFLFVSSLVVWP